VGGSGQKQNNERIDIMMMEMMPMLAEFNANFTLGVAGAGAGIGVGLTGMAAAGAVGRNPTAFGKILTIAIIGMALAEAIAIYGLVSFFL